MGLLSGFGKIATITTASQRFVLNENDLTFYANQVSIYNAGDTVVWAAVNIPKADFDVAASSVPNSGRAVPVAPKQAFSFSGMGAPPISSLCLVSASGSNEVYIGAL